MTRRLVLLLLAVVPFGAYADGNLRVVVSGIDPSKGNILAVMVYDSERAYKSEESFIRESVPLDGDERTCEFVFTDVPEGPLMIIGLQDANGNLEMDTGLFGIPKEGFFCSQNASVPNWNRCVFRFEGGNAVIRLDMIYW